MSADGTGGFDPHMPGTPEEHWVQALDDLADTVAGDDLLPPGADLVVLSAHPDDESLAAGGLLATAAALGRPATLVVATSGEASHPRSPTHSPARLAGIREVEVAEALHAVHPGALLVLLRLPDGHLDGHRGALAESLRRVVGSGTVLAAPWRRDGHTDHEAAGAVAAEVAAATGAALLEYPVWLWHWGTRVHLAGTRLVRLPLGPDAQGRRDQAQRAHRSQVGALSEQPGDEVLLPPHVVQRFTRPFEVFVRTGAPTGDHGDHGAGGDGGAGTAPGQGVRDREFDAMFEGSDDPWGFETRWYERRKRAVTLAVLPRRDLGRVLEVGCSTGVLTAELAARAETVLGTDVSAEAVRRARERLAGASGVTITRMRAPQEWPTGTFDLVVLSEVGYFWDADELDRALALSRRCLAPDGVLALCHWRHPVEGWPLDGDAVHAAALTVPGLRAVVSHVEEDFRVDVLVAGGWQTPAAAEGLT